MTIRNAAPAVQAPVGHPARVFGQGIIEPTPTWPPSVEEARAWYAERKAKDAVEARTVTRRQIDAGWKLGNDLGHDGDEAYAPQTMTFVEREAFRQGWDAGMSELCEGMALDALEASGIEVEDMEWAEARMSPPAVPYCFA